jgi:23S rRNA (adenine2503-C2)-methyltransferase
MTDLKTLNRAGIQALCKEMGVERYRADQLFEWVFGSTVPDFDGMSNLPKALRERLKTETRFYRASEASRQISKDGTAKFLFQLEDQRLVEAVLIPEFFDDGVADRLTVCVSSQVGCMFGCSFCATGRMGLLRNLTMGEIVDQVLHINDYALEKHGKRITNIVYMGMGEPMHNYEAVMQSAHAICDAKTIGLSPKRITISTVGLAPLIKRFGDEEQPFNLAISLHAPTDEKRSQIMPINESLDLGALRKALEHYFSKSGKAVTYEYLLFDQFNDSSDDARHLAGIAQWIPSKVNIIMYNHVAGVSLHRAKEDRLDAFLRQLVRYDVRATVRRSRGDDIDAGCGQLAIREGEQVIGEGKTLAKAKSVS